MAVVPPPSERPAAPGRPAGVFDPLPSFASTVSCAVAALICDSSVVTPRRGGVGIRPEAFPAVPSLLLLRSA
eukprot:7086681-Prymnesium_polylepis.2